MAGNRAADSSSIPMTMKVARWTSGGQHWFFHSLQGATGQLTIIDHLELSDQMQPDLGELVLQQRKEEGQEVFLGSLLPEERSQPADLLGERGSDMLRAVGRQCSDARKDPGENDVAVDKLSEACRTK
jgi:hypothetical protein